MPFMTKMKGKFITFEGGEGAGKGTQINILVDRLRNEGYDVSCSREPGGTLIGEKCRDLLKSKEYNPNAITELFLFEAGRSEYMEKIVIPALEKGTNFISDRFYDSTNVYQGLVRGLGLELTNQLNNIATKGITPDLTIVLDVNHEIGVANAIEQSRFEAEGDEFHKKVNEYYRNLPKYFPERNIVVIPRKSIEEVSELVYFEVKKILQKIKK
jgi:dTMP kinase